MHSAKEVVIKPGPLRGGPSAAGLVYLIDESLSILRVRLGVGADAVAMPSLGVPKDLSVGQGRLHVLIERPNGTSAIGRALDEEATQWRYISTRVRATRIAAGPDGRVWHLDDCGAVHVIDPGTGISERITAGRFAEEISVGGDGRVWVISTDPRYAGRVVRWRESCEPNWHALPPPSAATKVAADSNGLAWTINSLGALWRLHPLGSGNFAECQVDTDCERCIFGSRRHFARDVAIDASGTLWALSVDPSEGGYQLMYLAEQSTKRFVAVPGVGGVRVVAG